MAMAAAPAVSAAGHVGITTTADPARVLEKAHDACLTGKSEGEERLCREKVTNHRIHHIARDGSAQSYKQGNLSRNKLVRRGG